MGLDIHLQTDIADLYGAEFMDYFYKHSLSRTFCNLMCRRDVICNEEPELDQIGAITGVDIGVLYEMNNYPNEDAMEYFISSAEDEAQRMAILAGAEADKLRLSNNIDEVDAIIGALIDKVCGITDIASLLSDTAFDTLDREVYFKDFLDNPGDGYIGNNFGQDLRNFRDFILFAKSKGANGIWFNYG
jgi:hypothetical protein